MASFKVDYSAVKNKLESMEKKSAVAIKMYAQEGAKKFENYAKTNRRWTDRTGHARQRLTGWVEVLADKVRICIGHGVDYGVYLELCNEKRFAILQPTLNAQSAEVLKGFENLVRRLK